MPGPAVPERVQTVYVNHYYFYIDDEDFGPLFLKVCSYAPWGIKLRKDPSTATGFHLGELRTSAGV
jgi:hypothetical protein